jgi:flagellar hook-associated protein 1
MGGIGLVLNVAKDALLTQQYAMDVTSHNIANVSTDGYSRQSALLTAKDAAPFGGFMFGRGVELNNILRNTNSFLEKRLQNGESDLNSVSEQETYMSVVETIFDENSSASLSTQLNEFWSAWNDLSNNPSGIPERNLLVENGTLLSESFNDLNSNLDKLGSEINTSIDAGVTSINQIITQLADINQKIVSIEASGNANDLRDQRDQLVTELSGYIDVNTYEYDDGNLVVATGKGYTLVSRGDTYPLKYEGGQVLLESSKVSEINITDSIAGGKMGGWLEIRDNVIPEYSANLDELAKSIAWEVNSVQSQGVGLEAFSSTTGTYSVDDPAVALGSDSSGLDYSDKITDGSFKIWVYDSSGAITSESITVDADKTTMNDLQTAIDGITGLNSTMKNGKLYVGADSGYTFAFSDDTSNALAALGVNTFFQGSGARDIAINKVIVNDKNSITAAKISNNIGPAVGASDNISTGIVTTEGQYTGTADGTYDIEIIDSSNFQWRKDGGAWTSSAIAASVSLSDGVTVGFDTKYGSFTGGDSFAVDVTASTDTNGEFAVGDNTNALAVSDLQYQDVSIKQWSYGGEDGAKAEDLTNLTIDEYMHMLSSSIGIKSDSIQRQKEYKATIQNELATARDNISGVSLDEEMANLIKFQQAYTAAAKLITTSEEMLDTLLNSYK